MRKILNFFENHYEAVVATDNNGIIMFINKKSEQNFKIKVNDILGLNIKEVIPEMIKLNNFNEFVEFEKKINNNTLFYEYRATISNENLIFYFFRDITITKNEEIAQKDYFNMVNHDLRSPIGIIISFIGLIKEMNLLNDKLLKYVNIIDKTSLKTLDIMDSYLRINKLNNINIIEKKIVSVSCIKKIIDKITILNQDDFIIYSQIVGIVDVNHKKVKIDDNLFSMMITNLIENAIHASLKKEIGILIYKNENNLLINITNDGEIPKEYISKIFQKNFSSKDNGNGIGLFSAQKIANEHGGYITFSSKSGQTKFTISIPFFDK